MSANETAISRASPSNDTTASVSDKTEPETVAAVNGWHGVNAGLEIAQLSAQAMQRSMEQAATFFGFADGGEHRQNTTANATHNFDVLLQCHTALANGRSEIVGIATDAIRAGFSRNIENAGRLFKCRTLTELGAVQSDIMRQSIEAMIQNNLCLLESSVQTAHVAAERCRATTV